MIHSPDFDAAELERMFERAAELGPPERRALLDEVRSRHPRLADELESLLAFHDSAADILDRPVSLEDAEADDLAELTTGPSGSADDLLGLAVEGFRIDGWLGAGGSSDVYRAEQDRPRRPVALKVMLDAVTSPVHRRRFADEAETLAKLDHPHVARVFGAGRAEGPRGPFSWIAVEFIPSPRTITEFADEAGLDSEQRLRLFLPVCDAVHHAHRKGVLHRDLKPANLLVSGTEEGGPKVIDFGLARLLEPLDAEEQQRTRSGELLGTLRYMSPEQCAGDPDRLDLRTDVYALGVVLYELMTGHLPYELEGESLLAILETIRTAAPIDPRRYRPELERDLCAVLATALAKDPEERYDSVADLAADLRRFLASQPIEARPPTLRHRVRLFARRRTALFAGLVAGSAAAIVAVTTIVFLWLRASDALEDVRSAEERVREREALVEEARGELAQLQGRLDTLVGTEGSTDDSALAEALVEQASRARDSAESAEDRRVAVADAVQRLAMLRSLLGDDPESAASLASAFEKVGDLHGAEWTASPEDARNSLAAYAEGVQLWRRVVAARPDDASVRAELVDALIKLADSYRKVRRLREGRTFADEAVALARREVQGDRPSRDAVGRLVFALWTRGDVHIDLEPYEQGLADSREAMAWVDGLLEIWPGDPDVAGLAAWTLLRLGIWTNRLESLPEEALAYHAWANDLVMECVEAGASTARTPLRDSAETLYNVFFWQELTYLLDHRTEDEVTARLTRFAEVGERLQDEDSLFAALPTLTWITAELVERTEDPAERATLVARLREGFAVLGRERAARARERALGHLAARPVEGPHAEALAESLKGDEPLPR